MLRDYVGEVNFVLLVSNISTFKGKQNRWFCKTSLPQSNAPFILTICFTAAIAFSARPVPKENSAEPTTGKKERRKKIRHSHPPGKKYRQEHT
ncbi:hypothetical protein DDZ16_08360 [Marinilabilia rubra]|uniref:Uncharacterized protein n=1 Tax=Marinilabilia rubra TaxID=2162893 RepID=A0A2U2BA21_9BACT|nr:hypothetical protein DDZ16_08360 [Marinilabilia rubra]